MKWGRGMPELPEVETIRLVLSDILPGQRIQQVHLHETRMLRGQPQSEFKRRLRDRRITQLDRRGKFLLIRLDSGSLLVHLGMSGQVILSSDSKNKASNLLSLPDKHTHMILELDSNSKVYFRDPRMFGRFGLIDEPEEKSLFARLGPEPLSPQFTSDFLHSKLKGRKASIKSLLMNQSIVAGLGNIYADESLHRAGLLPRKPGGKLTQKNARSLHRAIRRVIKEAVMRGGTSVSDFLDPKHRRGTFQLVLKVYGRDGQPCLRCGELIHKEIVAQRGTHWCPRCQFS
jgi:formamidopyrimidine-DNA glycosylase